MHILVVTPWFPRFENDPHGGFIYDSVTALQELGHDVTVLVLEPYRPAWMSKLHSDWRMVEVKGEDFVSLNVQRLRFLSLPRNWLRRLSNRIAIWSLSSRVRKLFDGSTYDVIHAHNEAPADIIQRLSETPVVMSVHGVDTSSYRRTDWFRCYFRDLSQRVSQTIFVGESTRHHYQKQYGDLENSCVISNGVSPEPGLGERVFDLSKMIRFVSVSNLHTNKGIEQNLEMLKRLVVETDLDIRYTIVGAGNKRTLLEQTVSEHGLESQVTFAGGVCRDQVWEYLYDADVFCLPSRPEAFGIVYLEAMSAGLITIGMAGEGPAGFIEPGVNGFLLSERDSSTMVDLILEIARLSSDELSEISQSAKDSARSRFSWVVHAESLSQLLAKVSRT